MSKVTSKLQVSIPKAVATRYGLKPGDEVTFLAAGDSIRLVPPAAAPESYDVAERLEIFDCATRRLIQRKRRTAAGRGGRQAERGWTRAELYERGRAR